MLYLISGASRSGKTMIAREILKQRGVLYLSLDWIVMGFTNGMPECGIHDKLFPDEIAFKLRTFLEAMIASMLWTGQDQVIEGEAILPESVRALLDERPAEVRACFLGYAEISVSEKVKEVKNYSAGSDDWLTQESDETIQRHIKNMVKHSDQVKLQCARHKVRYFDTSFDFVTTVKRATDYLLTGE